MPAELIEDFRRGLDTRKFVLDSPAGTLTTLQNGHITPGADIEKRKAFTAPALLPNCYGIEVTATGWLTFGSNAMAFTATTLTSVGDTTQFDVGFGFAVPVGTRVTVGSNSQGLVGTQTVTASTASTITIARGCGSGDGSYSDTVTVSLLTFPGPATDAVSYQRLQHPDGSTAMTEVLHSTVYDGKAFVIATFGSGGTFAFYNGTLVYDFISGRATAWLTSNSDLAAHLSALINRSGVFSSSSTFGTITVTSPSGLDTELTIEKDTDNGTLTNPTHRTQVDGITGVSSFGQFTIQAGTVSAGNSKFTSVRVGSQELLPAAVDYVTNNVATAAAVKDAINGRQATALATSDRERTGSPTNICKLTLGAHKFITGDVVTVAGVGGTGYNGVVTLTAYDATSISYAATSGTSSEASTSDSGGTVTMTTRVFVAAADGNVVQLSSGVTGDDANDRAVAVTTASGTAGGICVDSYSFTLTMNSGAAASGGSATVPQISALYINGVEALGSAATGADIPAVVADAAAKIVASTSVTGYTAAVVGNTLYISRKDTGSSSSAATIMVIVDAQGGVVTSPGDSLLATAGPENLTLFGPGTSGLTSFVGGTALFVNASGGTAPYTYLWEPMAGAGGGTGLGFTAGSPATGQPKVEFLGEGGTPDNTVRSPVLKITRNATNAGGSSQGQRVFTGYVRCTVTDSRPGTVKRVITVDLFLTFKFYNYS